MNESLHILCPHCHTVNRVPGARLAERPNCGRCQKSLFDGHPMMLNKVQFERHIARNDIPILVDFWASWCGPCKIMAPHFESATRLLEPKVRLAKVDIETEQALASRYAIQSIPTLVLYYRGGEVARISGSMGTQDLVRWVSGQLDQH